MRSFTRGLALVFCLLVVAPTVASAQAVLREFKGKIDQINKKQMIVDNRMGDKLKFLFIDGTTVEGEKDAVARLKKGDWVIVSWKMMDNPRIAYKVVVIPEEAEAGEEVE